MLGVFFQAWLNLGQLVMGHEDDGMFQERTRILVEDNVSY